MKQFWVRIRIPSKIMEIIKIIEEGFVIKTFLCKELAWVRQQFQEPWYIINMILVMTELIKNKQQINT